MMMSSCAFVPYFTTSTNNRNSIVSSHQSYTKRPLWLQTNRVCCLCCPLLVGSFRYKSKPFFLARCRPSYRPTSQCFSLVASEVPQEENASEANEQPPTNEEESSSSSSPNESESPDILQSPSFLKRKLELLQQELEEAKTETSKLEKQYNEQKEAYVRLAADFENYRKRMNKEKQDIADVAKANVVRELISVLDNFERAAAAIVASTENEKKIHDSYQALAKQLLDAMMKLNVEPIDAVGQPFNPNIHEAVNRVDSEDHEEGVVAMQYQRGYKIGERLVRPALCVVSSGPGPSKKDEQAKDEETKSLENNGVF